MTRDSLAATLDVVRMLIELVLAPLVVAWLAQHRKADQQTARQAMEGRPAEHAANAVAKVETDFVRDLKDPSKPGTWDDLAKAHAKELAVEMIKDTAPDLVDAVGASGVKVGKMLDQLVERKNVEMQAKVAAASPVVAVNAPAVVVEAVPTTEPAPDPEAHPAPVGP